MGVIKRLLLILSIISICLSIKVECQQQKAQVTRTALHVARSLDPEAMETLTVKTKAGDVATLIVKKREGRHHHPDHHSHQNSTNATDTSVEMIPIASSSNIYESISVEDHNQTENAERTAKKVPDPVFIRSDTVLVKGHQNDLFNNKRARNLLKLDSDGIPVVTGVRMPDDESDKQVWRNARVINGVLMPYDKTQPKHTFNVRNNYSSQLLNHEHNKKKVQSTHLNQGSWSKLDESAHKSTDKPKPNRQTVHLTSQTTSSPSSPLSSTLGTQWTPPNLPSPQDVVAIVGAPIIQEWHQYPQEVVKVIDDTQPVLKEEDKYLRDKILEYIKNVNKQELNRNQNGRQQAYRGAKMIDYPIEIESRALHQPIPLSTIDHPIEIDNARNFEQQFHERDAKNLGISTIDVQESRLIDQPIEVLARNNYGHQSPIVEIDMRNSPIEAQPLRMESRMLQTPGDSVYPESLLYSPQGAQPSTRLSVEEGVRTPVLQYAHPELGVQPADIESRFRGIDDGLLDNGREQAIAYFAHDIHADRSPFAFEPGMEEEETKVNENSQRSHGDTPALKPKKISSQFHTSQSVNGGNGPNKYYGKYENYYPSSNLYQQQYSRPFWERIGDSIREHVQTGMDRMSEMTRPVVEPLVEATHKISHNLGLGSNRELATFKEKLGVASSPSVILPALGLVAGGAALGLGAVAVGRYLDVDMLKRSGGEAERIGEDQLEMEHKRAMSGIEGLPIGYQDEAPPLVNSTNPSNSSDVKATPTSEPIEFTTVEETSSKTSETIQRRRRDLLQNVDEINPSSSMTSNGNINGLSSSTLWSNTPCAKKTFCNAMLAQTGDDVIVMEKKMATYLAMLNPVSRAAIGLHLDDVMQAVNNRDCSAFHCRHDISDIPVPR